MCPDKKIKLNPPCVDFRLQIWVNNHLLKTNKLYLFPKVISLFDEAKYIIEKVKMDLSSQEGQFVRQFLGTRDIPSPKLIIKYQNKIKYKG